RAAVHGGYGSKATGNDFILRREEPLRRSGNSEREATATWYGGVLSHHAVSLRPEAVELEIVKADQGSEG
ncbi:unnamed protein product, partial [Amoebophrya sp. A120]